MDYQDRTSAELREKLIKKNFNESAVDEVVTAFQESGIVNDERYALLYTQSKLNSGKGSRWIKQKLREKGIPAEIAENAIKELKDSRSLRQIRSRRIRRDSPGIIRPVQHIRHKLRRRRAIRHSRYRPIRRADRLLRQKNKTGRNRPQYNKKRTGKSKSLIDPPSHISRLPRRHSIRNSPQNSRPVTQYPAVSRQRILKTFSD